MLDPTSIPQVADNELLARYATRKDDVRADHTIREKLFIAYKHVELSVTRHKECTEEELWNAGHVVAAAMLTKATHQSIKLRGRADISAGACKPHGLDVVADPIDGNPNHANITNYPSDKSAQKLIALQLASQAKYIPLH